MLDIIKDTLIDTIKLLPFLFITFIIIEYIEHKINNKKIITKSKKSVNINRHDTISYSASSFR